MSHYVLETVKNVMSPEYEGVIRLLVLEITFPKATAGKQQNPTDF